MNINAKNNSDFIPMVRSGWGIYPFKPKYQKLWEQEVRHAVAELKCDKVPKADLRPRLLDANSGLSILLDTGAQVSVWPRNKFADAAYDPTHCCNSDRLTRPKVAKYISIVFLNTCWTFLL